MSRNGQKITSGAVAERRGTRRRRSTGGATSKSSPDRARLAAIVENSQDAILSKDVNGTVLSWNKAAQRLFGYRPREIIGRSVTLILPPDRLAEEKAILDRVRRNQRVLPYETVRLAKSGKPIDVMVSVSPLPDSRGRIVGASTIIRDISQQKRAEAALRISEDRFRLVYRYAPVGLEQVALADGRLLEVNEHLCRMLGYSREQLLKKTFAQLTHPDDLLAERKLLRQLIEDQIASYTSEKRYLRKDGRPVWVRVTSAKPSTLNGRPYRISVIQDMNEQKEAEAALRDSEQRMRAVVETAVDAIVTIDERGRIDSANPATERMFGYSAAEMVGQNVKMLMPEPYRGEHDGYLKNYARTGRAKIIGIGREVTGLRKDGTAFPLNLSVSEVRLDGKRLFTGILHDLTGRRRLERQILEAAANEQRRIGQDLHDGLCQDLVGIGFTADTLARQLLARLAPEGDTLSQLGNMMRNAASQARDLAHGLNPVDLKGGGLPAALNALAEKISHSFGVKCGFHWDGKAQIHDDGAATHLYRITQEAVGNAIRHGKATTVDIRFRCVNGRLVLSIADNGSGLPGHVTERVGRTAVHVPEGMGLQTMQYRARVVGGTFEIGPRSGGGTVVTCSLIAHPACTIPV